MAEKAKETEQSVVERLSELVDLPGHDRLEDFSLPLPHTYVKAADMPANFNWQNINGTSFVTKSLNQHIPQVVWENEHSPNLFNPLPSMRTK